MKEQKKYNPKEIYFGNQSYDTGKDGNYETGAEAFIKVGDDEYSKLRKPNIIMAKYYPGTTDYTSIKRLIPLTHLIKGEIPDFINERTINLYLLKYKLTMEKEVMKNNCCAPKINKQK